MNFKDYAHSAPGVPNSRTSLKMILIALLLVTYSGCVSRARNKFDSDGIILLHAGARDLRGVKAEDVMVTSDNTVADVANTTQLVRKVAEKSKEAVVSIYVKTQTPYRLNIIPFSPFGGIPMNVPGIGLGSGFFIHPSGYILTNNHVVEHAEQIMARTNKGVDYVVTVIANDPAYDLALLKVKNGGDKKFDTLAIGDSDAVDAGDMVIAVGNPLGLGHTVTAGIISKTYRNLGVSQSPGGREIEFIQTDTAINPGSSGGPLITLTGACVGINTAVVARAQGIGFAVPSKLIKIFLDEVRAGKGKSANPEP
ncbi:MAG: S1C family serine protease [Planctomycetota bacterium]|jgi:S1-C subfamily serine protease